MSAVPRVHAVTTARILARPDFLARARALALGPDVAIHVRHAPTARDLAEVTGALVALAADTGTRILVNDRADVAAATGAHGVHLPADGLPEAAARALLPPGSLVGRSTHSAAEARAAHAAGADYVLLGPIFATPSHPDQAPLGPDALADAAGAGPVIAIGGITPERAAACRVAGARGIAAIRALWDADDSGSAARRFLLSFPS